MNFIEKTCKVVVQTITEQEITGWPPSCFGIFYQPPRPYDEVGVTSKSKKE